MRNRILVFHSYHYLYLIYAFLILVNLGTSVGAEKLVKGPMVNTVENWSLLILFTVLFWVVILCAQMVVLSGLFLALPPTPDEVEKYQYPLLTFGALAFFAAIRILPSNSYSEIIQGIVTGLSILFANGFFWYYANLHKVEPDNDTLYLEMSLISNWQNWKEKKEREERIGRQKKEVARH